MKKWPGLLIVCLLLLPGSVRLYGQSVVSGLPVQFIPGTVADTSKPLIMYISGDGGNTKFTQTFVHSMAVKGFPIAALNSNKYFWDKKTPEQTTSDVAALIKYCQLHFNRSKVVLIGYSFGADVMPFVYNRLPGDVLSAVKNVVLLSPSANADFEIHLNVMWGAKSKGPNTLPEINRMTSHPVLLLLEDKKEFPVSQVTLKNYTAAQLPHDDGKETNAQNTGNLLVQYLAGVK